jgi:hypothetical protein
MVEVLNGRLAVLSTAGEVFVPFTTEVVSGMPVAPAPGHRPVIYAMSYPDGVPGCKSRLPSFVDVTAVASPVPPWAELAERVPSSWSEADIARAGEEHRVQTRFARGLAGSLHIRSAAERPYGAIRGVLGAADHPRTVVVHGPGPGVWVGVHLHRDLSDPSDRMRCWRRYGVAMRMRPGAGQRHGLVEQMLYGPAMDTWWAWWHAAEQLPPARYLSALTKAPRWPTGLEITGIDEAPLLVTISDVTPLCTG